MSSTTAPMRRLRCAVYSLNYAHLSRFKELAHQETGVKCKGGNFIKSMK